MCDECLIGFFSNFLSVAIFIMNFIYAIWGLILPNDEKRENFEHYIMQLETYVNIVSYSDAVLIPIKIILIIMLRYCCCNRKERDDFP